MIKFTYKQCVFTFEGHASTKENCAAFSFIINYWLNTSACGQSDKSDSINGLAKLDITDLSVRDTQLLWNMLEFYNDHIEKIQGIKEVINDA